MFMFTPSHPGDLIRETITGLHEETGKRYTMEEIAEGLGTTRKTLSAIVNKRQSVTPEMALRLAAAFRNTTAEYWLDLQKLYDLCQARKTVSTENVRVLWDPANRKSSRVEKV